MRRIIVLLLAIIFFLPLVNAKPQIQVYGQVQGLPTNANITNILFTSYSYRNSEAYYATVILPLNYTVILDGHTYYIVWVHYQSGNQSQVCSTSLGKLFQSTQIDLYCYEG